MESNEKKTTVIKKRGRPKGTFKKKKILPDPAILELKESGLAASEGEPIEVHETSDEAALSFKKKYPIAYKWPDFKFHHCMVMRGEGNMVEYDGLTNNQAAPHIIVNRGVGCPVTILLGKPVVLPNEIVEAIKDTTVRHPVVLGGTIDEKSNGFNGYEMRSRFKIMIAGPATPEEYEANVLIGTNRRA